MSTSRKSQTARAFDLTITGNSVAFDVETGVAARVAWSNEHGAMAGGDSLKVQIDPGGAGPLVDFASAKTLDNTTKVVQITQDEMRGVSRLAVVKSGTATTTPPKTASIYLTQDQD